MQGILALVELHRRILWTPRAVRRVRLSTLSSWVGRQSAVGSRQPAAGSRQPAAGSRQSAVGSRQSAVGSRQSAVGSQQSAVSSHHPGVIPSPVYSMEVALDGLVPVVASPPSSFFLLALMTTTGGNPCGGSRGPCESY